MFLVLDTACLSGHTSRFSHEVIHVASILSVRELMRKKIVQKPNVQGRIFCYNNGGKNTRTS